MTIDYIITLGGDGTILWAAKQFNGDYIPPIVTFSQGSLGFMCNFVFEDHPVILNHILNDAAKGTCTAAIGIEERFRLKINMGEGTNKDRKVFRGDQLEHSEPISIEHLLVGQQLLKFPSFFIGGINF